MLKHEFSYFLNAKKGENATTSPDDVLNDLNRSVLADEDIGNMKFSIEDGAVIGEVDPDVKTIPEESTLVLHVAEIAKKHPGYEFQFDEYDEENKSVGRTTIWRNGQQVCQRNPRVVPNDRQYDSLTVKAIVTYLNDRDPEMAADIKAKFDY